jgi:uncharacterized repeat protein (TIGR01451 family)
MVVKKEMIRKCLVSAHGNKNHAVPFSLALKSTMSLKRFSIVALFFLLLGLFSQQVCAQNIFFDDFGTNTSTVRTSTPYMPSGSFTYGSETVSGVQTEINDNYYAVVAPPHIYNNLNKSNYFWTSKTYGSTDPSGSNTKPFATGHTNSASYPNNTDDAVLVINAGNTLNYFYVRSATLTPGNCYRLSFWMYLVRANAKVAVDLESGVIRTVLGSFSTGNLTTEASWVQYSVDFSIPLCGGSDARTCKIGIRNDYSLVNGNDYYIDDISLDQITCSSASNPITPICLSGTVWDDKNNSAAGSFTNIYTSGESGTNVSGTLYATLLNAAGTTVLASAAVASDGSYSLTNIPINTSNLILRITSSLGVEGSTSPPAVATLATDWVNTSPLSQTVTTVTSSIASLDFGVEQKPTANAVTQTICNLGSSTAVQVSTLNGTDLEDGPLGSGNTVVINTLPAASVTLKYNGTAVSATQTITSYDPTKLTVTPTSVGAFSTSFTYSFKDAGSQASSAKTVSLNFVALPTAPTSVTPNTGISICSGSSTNLNATSAGNTIYWYTVATGGTSIGSSASGANFSVSPTVSTTYYAESSNASSCTSSNRTPTALITVNPVLSGNSSGASVSICNNNSTILTGGTMSGGSGSYTYLWKSSDTEFGTYSAASGTNDQANYNTGTLTTSSTKVWFQRTVTSGGCTDVATAVKVTVNPILTAGVSVSADQTTVCQGTKVTFTATPTNGGTSPTYQWYNGTTTVGTNSATYAYTPTPGNTDAITVQMTSNATPCLAGSPVTSSPAIAITVNPKPIMTSANAKTICSGTVVGLDLTSDVTSGYTWIATDNVNVTGESTTAQTSSTINDNLVNTSTTPQDVVYTVTPTSTTGNCGGTAQIVTIRVNPLPTISGVSSVYAGQTITLIGSGTANLTTPWLSDNQSAAKVSDSGVVNGVLEGTSSITYTNSNGCQISALITVLASSDLEVTKICSSSNPSVGDEVTFTITAKNNGPSAATGVKVTDALPTGYSWVSDDSSGTYDHSTGNSTSGTWDIGALAKDGTKVLKIVAKVL